MNPKLIAAMAIVGLAMATLSLSNARHHRHRARDEDRTCHSRKSGNSSGPCIRCHRCYSPKVIETCPDCWEYCINHCYCSGTLMSYYDPETTVDGPCDNPEYDAPPVGRERCPEKTTRCRSCRGCECFDWEFGQFCSPSVCPGNTSPFG